MPRASDTVGRSSFILISRTAKELQGVSLAIGPQVFLITFKVIDVI
jgi:hypothetical protein